MRCLGALAFLSSATALVSRGVSVELAGINYFVSPVAETTVATDSFTRVQDNFGLVPGTVVPRDVTASSQLFANWSSVDDVWQPGFLENILASEPARIPKEAFYKNVSFAIHPLNGSLPAGPYFINTYTGTVHQAFRLYADFADAFTQPVLQRNDTFQTLSAQVASSASVTIGVPSRLYFTKTADKPLAGVRVGVKDIYSLAGLKKSCGNRAYFGLYPAANVTCTVVQNLVDAGAVVVGVQKTSQFANGETATADWVDQLAPFNPRGDGYRDTQSSSAGAGASIASYPWLDLALGSDTGGSVRGPAGNQGVFGNRPSHGLVSLRNVMPLSPTLDTPGFLARDPTIWHAACKALYKDNFTSIQRPKYPAKLLLLGLPEASTPRGKIVHQFVNDLGRFMNATGTKVDLHKEWKASAPAEAHNQTLSQLLNQTYAVLISKQQTKLLREPFYRDYAAAHDGRLPFVDPVPLGRWAFGDEQPASAEANAIRNKTLFMDWFNKRVLPPHDAPDTCSSGFLLYTGNGTLAMRNQYLQPRHVPLGFTNSQISIYSEAPDSVFPLGQVEEFSTITNHTEKFPVTINVVAAKGCDGLIARLALDLLDAGIIKVPKTGSGLDGGEILLRRQRV